MKNNRKTICIAVGILLLTSLAAMVGAVVAHTLDDEPDPIVIVEKGHGDVTIDE